MNPKPLVAVLYSLHPMHLCCTSHEVCTQCCAVAAGVRGGRAGARTNVCMYICTCKSMGRQSWQQLPCPHLVGVGEVVREERGRVTRYGVSKRIARGVGVMRQGMG